jgi:hypothetical protein
VNNNEILVSCFLFIIAIGTIFSLIYTITGDLEEKIFVYLRRISFGISAMSFGFCIILTIIFLIGLMTKVTMALFGY